MANDMPEEIWGRLPRELLDRILLDAEEYWTLAKCFNLKGGPGREELPNGGEGAWKMRYHRGLRDAFLRKYGSFDAAFMTAMHYATLFYCRHTHILFPISRHPVPPPLCLMIRLAFHLLDEEVHQGRQPSSQYGLLVVAVKWAKCLLGVDREILAIRSIMSDKDVDCTQVYLTTQAFRDASTAIRLCHRPDMDSDSVETFCNENFPGPSHGGTRFKRLLLMTSCHTASTFLESYSCELIRRQMRWENALRLVLYPPVRLPVDSDDSDFE
jgi:hypothetical protein